MNPAQSVSQESVAAAQAAGQSAGSLDQIRDILFGAWSREVHQRFEELERRLESRFSELRADSEKRLEDLESFTREELRALGDRLTEEGQAREVASGNLERGISELGKKIRTRIDEWVKVSEHNWDQLRDAKADRDDLAGLFRDFAEKIAPAAPNNKSKE